MKFLVILNITLFLITCINCSFQASIFNKICKEKKGENIIISPLSIFQVLSLTANGAKGDTLSEMLEVLEAKTLDELNDINYNIISTIKEFTTVEIANAVMSRFTPLETFSQIAKEYLAPVEPLISAEQVNNWCSNKTHGKIDKIIEELEPDIALIFLNAVYFKGEWSLKFEEYSTKKLPFYNFGNDKIEVDTMSQIEYFKYYQDKKVQAIELSFLKDYMSAIILLPAEGTDINKYIDSLSISNDEFENIINGLKYAEVHLELPKFELEYEKELNQILIDLGMYNAFSSSDADFTGLRKQGNLYIDKVIHKTYLKVFEDGCEAAAVTIVEMKESAVYHDKEKIINMKVNRPFIFLLKNNLLPRGLDLLFMSKIEKLE